MKHSTMPDRFVVIVCGGRNYNNRALVFATLDEIHAATPITLLVNGGATGADKIAETWAIRRGIETARECADWRKYGDRTAGRVRNTAMLTKYKPDLVVAFKGGQGTADMKRQAICTMTQLKVIEEQHVEIDQASRSADCAPAVQSAR